MFDKLEETDTRELDLIGKMDPELAKTFAQDAIQLDRALEIAGVAYCEWRLSGGFSRANKRFFDCLSLPDNASELQIVDAILDKTHPEDLERYQDEYRHVMKHLEKHLLRRAEIRIKKDDEYYWYRIDMSRLGEGDSSSYFFLCWDLSDMKEYSEQEMATLKDHYDDQHGKLSNLVLDLESRRANLVEANNTILCKLEDSSAQLWCWHVKERLFDIDMPSLEDVETTEDGCYTFDKIIDKIHPEDLHKFQFDRNEDTFISDHTFSIEARLKYNLSNYTWFEFRGSVVARDENDNPSYLRGIFLNIQKRKSDEMALMQRIEALQEADKSRSALFSNFTQEIRTPLHAIVGFADILASIEDKYERQRYLEIIKNNNDALLKLVENVCEFAEAEMPEENLKKDKISIWEYMVELHQVYSMRIDNGVKLMFSNPYSNRRVILDAEKLTELMGMLLTNSIKTTQRGYISYGYDFDYTADKLLINIKDTGDALSADRAEVLYGYEKYDKGPNMANGFSFSLCKSLVNRMNGELYVDSKMNIGKTYSIELPLVFDEDEADMRHNVVVSEQKNESIVKRERELPVILVAEDMISSFMMLKTLLQDRFEVIHAENGAHAVELFREVNPVFVFMDIKMPGMDGIEATRRIRQISKDVPIVVLTAYAVRSLRKDASEAGCSDMLTKPTSTKQINATIRKFLKRDF